MGYESVFLSIVLGLICLAEAGMIGDQCDWTGRYVFTIYYCLKLEYTTEIKVKASKRQCKT